MSISSQPVSTFFCAVTVTGEVIILSLVKVYWLPFLDTVMPFAENLISDMVLLVSVRVRLYFCVSGLYLRV